MLGALDPHIGNRGTSAEEFMKTLSENDVVDFQVAPHDFESNWQKIKQTFLKTALKESRKKVWQETWYFLLPYLSRILGILLAGLAFIVVPQSNPLVRILLMIAGCFCLFILPMQLPFIFDFGSIGQITQAKKYYQDLCRFQFAKSFEDALPYLEDSYSTYYRQTAPGLDFYTAFVSLGYLHKISNDYEVEKAYYLDNRGTLVLGIKRRGDETAPVQAIKLSCNKRIDRQAEHNTLTIENLRSNKHSLVLVKKV